MATIIPIEGELRELPAPKSETDIGKLLGSPGCYRAVAPDGSTWWVPQPPVVVKNDRATRFFNARTGVVLLTDSMLCGDVLYLSADESRALSNGGVSEEYVPVHGRTYDVRDKLKAIGARWHAQEKLWKVPKSKLTEANDIVRKGP
jgi:hypothetical protein